MSSPRRDLVGSRVGHVRIDELLGYGGMGEVYRGFDEVLERPVAVKTIHPEHRLSGRAKARFLREARLLSKLDHPNICRVFDILERDDGDYLILEYIDGKTLREMLRQELDEEDKLRIAEQVATTLAVAHHKRVVHRDLKPDNIMITAAGGLKVLDFGIARSVEVPAAVEKATPGPLLAQNKLPAQIELDRDETRGLAVSDGQADAQDDDGDDEQVFRTSEGAIVGTAPYMSPEQIMGGQVSEAADIYSFGIVLQELLTGKPAYAESTGASLLLHVSQARTRPVEGLDSELTALLGDLQRLDPAQRPTAEEVLLRLQRLRERPQRIRRRRLLAAAVLAVLLLLIATVLVTSRLVRPPPLLRPGEIARVTLLPFANQTGQEANDWVELGLMEMVAATLDETPEVEVVLPQTVLSTLQELGIDRGQDLGAADLDRIGRALGTELVVSTAVSRDGDAFRFTYTISTSSGSLGSKQLSAADLLEGANLLNAQLSRRLDPQVHFSDLRDRFSSDRFANQAFAMGVQRLDSEGPQVARHYFEVCLDRDPEMLAARMHIARIMLKSGELDQAEVVARSVRDEARRRGDGRLEAASCTLLGTSAMDRGDYAVARQLLAESLRLCQEQGSKRGQAYNSYLLGGLTYRQGKSAEAQRLLDDSLQLSRSIGARRDEPLALSMLAILAVARNDRQEAERLLGEAAQITRELGMKERLAAVLINLATVRQRFGDLLATRTTLEEGIRLLRETGNRRGLLAATLNYGALLGEEGDIAAALQATSDAVAQAEEAGDRRLETQSRISLVYFLCRLGRLAEAETELERARQLAARLDDPEIVWNLTRNRAYLRILQGRLPEAAALLARQPSPPDVYTLQTEARLAYARGDYRRALALLEQARELPRTIWTPWREATRAAYAEAARTGRAVPLPGEGSIE